MVFETSYSGTYEQYKNYQQLAHPEFVLVHSTSHPEGEHRSAICLVKLLGISLQMDLDKIDVATRTGNRGKRGLNLHQSYVALYILRVTAAGVCNGPAVIPVVNDI